MNIKLQLEHFLRGLKRLGTTLMSVSEDVSDTLFFSNLPLQYKTFLSCLTSLLPQFGHCTAVLNKGVLLKNRVLHALHI